MKQHDLPTSLPRHLLSQAALAVACLAAGQAHALGLGRLNVQSALGETLRAEIARIDEVTEASIPPDFVRDQRIHRAYWLRALA